MKRKLTLSVDEALIPRAKRYAARHRISLSTLVEDTLRRLVDEAGAGSDGFAERWRGRLRAADRRDERYRALAEKYL
jgi:hypothetical protein